MTDTVDMAAEVTRYLDKLGTTAEEIRTSLLDLGFKGTRRVSNNCPLAHYLSDALRTRVSVGPRGVMVVVRVIALDRQPHTLRLPRATVSFFMDQFDRGRYPELEETTLTEWEVTLIDAVFGDHAP